MRLGGRWGPVTEAGLYSLGRWEALPEKVGMSASCFLKITVGATWKAMDAKLAGVERS